MRFGDFRMWAASWWAGVFGQTRLSRVGEGENVLDTVRMSDVDVIDLQRLEGCWDVAIPLTETQTAYWLLSAGGYSFALGNPSLRPTDGKAGDRMLYCGTAGTVIRLSGPGAARPGAIELTQADGCKILLDDGAVTLTDASGHTATLKDGVLAVDTTVRATRLVVSPHYSGDGDAPTVLPGTGLASGTASIASGSTDAAIRLDLKVGSMGGSPGQLAIITFARRYDRAPHPAVMPLDDIGATVPAAGSFYADATTSTLTISTTASLAANAELSLSLVLVQ